jgi:hypothetical protein
MERSCLLPRCGVYKIGKYAHKHTAGQERGREACRALCLMEERTRCRWPSWGAQRRSQHMCGRSSAGMHTRRRPTVVPHSHQGHGCRARGHATQELQPRRGSAGVVFTLGGWGKGVCSQAIDRARSLARGPIAWCGGGCQRQLLPWSLVVEIDMNISNSNSNSQENLKEFGECRNLE